MDVVSKARMAAISFLLVAGIVATAFGRSLTGSVEIVRGSSEARLVVPDTAPSPAPHDPKQDAAYPRLCTVEVADNGEFVQRFAMHAQTDASLAEARRAGRFYALLWGAANRRLGTLAAGLRRSNLDVWLSRSGDAGGEQFRTNIYVFDISSQRTGIEWARELAHEYGHYLLPGASGYTDPESWSNGILGERLFLSWLRDDLLVGRIAADEMPYVSKSELDDYCAKQVEPLVDTIRAAGPDRSLLAGTGRKAMDAFTGILLYADETYGSGSIMNMLDYLPQNASAGVRGTAFLDAFTTYVSREDRFSTVVPPSGSAKIFLPSGKFIVTVINAQSRVTNVRVEKPADVVMAGFAWNVRSQTPGWRKVTVNGDGEPVTLSWKRAG